VEKASKWSILAGLLLGLGAYFIALYPRIHISDMSVYDRVYIGMSREEAVNILNPALINCGLTESANANSCHFRDFWHNYYIDLNSGGRVFRKRREVRRTRIY
jgi:hypothetical protein